MKNLKKRILSFVSAVAMVATLLPTAALFSAAADPVVVDTGLTWDAPAENNSSDWSSSTRVTKAFNVETAGTYDLEAVWQGTQNNDIQSKIKVNGTDVTDVLHHTGDYWSNNTATATGIHLDAGENTISFEGKYFKYYKAEFTLTEADETLGNTISDLEVIRNNNAYGVVSKSNTDDPANYYENEKLTAIANDGYKFVNWTYENAETGNSEPIGTNSTLTLTSSMAGKTICANFGKINKVRFEAESFVNLVSEGFVTTYGNADPEVIVDTGLSWSEPHGTTDVYGNGSYWTDGSPAGSRTFNVSQTGTYRFGGTWQGTDGGDSEAKVKVDGKTICQDTGVAWTEKTQDATVDLTAGEHTIEFYGQNFVYYVAKFTLVEEQKLANKDYYAQKDDLTVGYDDPKVVEDNNKTNLSQVWDGKSYNNHKIAPAYSNGKAVALTGPSSAIAIPFDVNEALTDDISIKLGYNFGDMPTYYHSADGSGYESNKAVYVNLYMTSQVSSDVASALTSHGWKVSGNATPNYASDMMLRDSDTDGDGTSELQTAYYYELPKQAERTGTYVDGTVLASGTDETGRDTCQETSITLPAGLPAGKYYLSVATDKSNVYYNGANDRTYDTNGAVEKTYVDDPQKVGTAYYDYIEFEHVEEPGKPSPFTVGANFIFTDQWKNDLMSNSFSEATFNADTGKIMFNPSAPRYLVAQGYNIIGWTVEELKNGSYVPVVGLNVAGNTTDTNGYVSLRTNEEVAYDWDVEKGNIDNGCVAINSAAFPAGSTVRFTADYAVAVAPKTLTILNGKLYRKRTQSDEELMSLWADGTGIAKEAQVPNFGELRLEPSFAEENATFAYWTLNGMIYSFDADIRFSAWTDADFTAHIADGTQTTAVAFIDKVARTSGFEVDDVNYHKITFDCAFYVPSNASYVSSGIVYSNDTNAVKNASVAVDENTGALTVTSNTASKNVLYNTVKANLLLGGSGSNKYNRQVMVSLSNMKSGVSRAARAYMIYKQDGVYKLVLSGNVVTAKAATDPQSSSVSVN